MTTFQKSNAFSNKGIIITLLLFMISTVVRAQDAEISAGRPGMSTGVDVMPVNKVQWETGFGVERTDVDDDAETLWTINTTQLRFGVSQYAELQLGFDVLALKNDSETSAGISPIVLGTKLKIYDSGNWAPTVGLLAILALPVGSDIFRPDYAAPSLYLLFHHDIGEKWGLDYNVGTEWDGFSARPTVFAAINLGYSISDKLGVFIENYDYFAKNENADWNVDFGITYIPHPRIQLDASANMNMNNFGNHFIVGLGISWLIN